MIVTDETSQNSHSMHSIQSMSQLDIVPSSQVPKQQNSYYANKFKRKDSNPKIGSIETTKNRTFKPHAVNKIKVIVLVDNQLLEETALGVAIKSEFQLHEESESDEKFQIRGIEHIKRISCTDSSSTATATATAIGTADASPTTAPANYSIQWTRTSLTTYPTTIPLRPAQITLFEPFTLLALHTESFLEHMLLASDNIEFEQLGDYVSGLFVQYVPNNTACSKIVALVDLEKAALRVQRKISKEGNNRDVMSLLDSAVSYLLYEHDIEVFRCRKDSELAEYVYTLTRLVSNRIADAVVTEIDCVAKAQKEKPPEGLAESAREQFELQQTWSAMLQMLPLMSKDKAQTLIAHQAFSCPQHLLHHLHHNTDPEISGLSTENKKLLLQHAFGARKGSKNGTVQKQAKLSKHVYNLMTSMEPEDLISKV